jgi:hypothetical protein
LAWRLASRSPGVSLHFGPRNVMRILISGSTCLCWCDVSLRVHTAYLFISGMKRSIMGLTSLHLGPQNVMCILVSGSMSLASARRQTLLGDVPLYLGSRNVHSEFRFGSSACLVSVSHLTLHALHLGPRTLCTFFWGLGLDVCDVDVSSDFLRASNVPLHLRPRNVTRFRFWTRRL